MKNLFLALIALTVVSSPLSASAIEGEYYLTLQLASSESHNDFACILGAFDLAEQVTIEQRSNGRYVAKFADGSRGSVRVKGRNRWIMIKKTSYAGTLVKSRYVIASLIKKSDLYSARLKETTSENGTRACTTSMSGYGFQVN